MKKLIFCISIFFFCFPNLYAQPTWFKIHDLGLSSEEAWISVSNDENIYIFVGGYNNTVPRTRNAIVKFTKQGDLVWIRFLKYSTWTPADISFYFPKMMVLSKDNDLYALSYGLNENSIVEMLINKFDVEGNLIWAKTYGFEGVNTFSQAFGLTMAADSLGLIMTGLNGLPYPDAKYAIIKIDSAGNEQWKNLFPVPPKSIGESVPVVQMPDGTVKIAFDNNFASNYEDYLMSLDSIGNVQYSYANPFTELAVDLKLHPNGNLVYLSNEQKITLTGERGGMRIQMLTPTFDTVWTHLFLDTQFPYLFLEHGFVRNLSISPDGKILALGYNTTNCVLLCYDPEGTLLWKREIALEGFNALKFNYASWDTDCSIILDGYIYGGDYDPIDPDHAKIFIMKLDCEGCLVPGCYHTIITDTKEASTSNEKFNISPNPTKGVLKVEYLDGNLDNYMDYTIKIFNYNGILIFQETQPTPITTFDLSGQPSGIYTLSIYNQNQKYFFDKIIKI
jgi:hypothetical protein